MNYLPALGELIQTHSHALAYGALLSTRVGVAMASMPAPFGSLAPTRVRAAMSFLLAMSLTLARGSNWGELPVGGMALVGAAFGEAMVGGVIGLTVRVTLAAAEVAGTVASFAMGLGFANSVDPNYGETSAPPTQLLAFLSTWIFLSFNGHHAVVAALSSSIDVAPLGNVGSAVVHDGVFSIGSRMLARGLQIASPVLGTMIVIQIGLALASRAAPKVHLMYLSFAVSIGAGVLTLFVSAPSLAIAIASEVRQLPTFLAQALGGG